MEKRRNYSRELEDRLVSLEQEGRVPRLLLHACCAPCSSYVLEYLSSHFRISLFYYNPNITDSDEYRKRVLEVRRLVRELPVRYPVEVIEGEYEPRVFTSAVKGLENEPEGGARCAVCFRLRLEKAAGYAARMAEESGEEVFFTTTLTISPLKNAFLLNGIGSEAAAQYRNVTWLDSDFKKRDGYKRSIELSALHNLYRQNYCGCIYSKRNRGTEIIIGEEV